MLTLEALMLAGGAKGFFENPEYLIGIPMMAVGAIGVVVILLLSALPSRRKRR